MFSFLSKIPVISQIDPSKTWVYYQLAVVIGTWAFAAGIWYTAYLVKFEVVPALKALRRGGIIRVPNGELRDPIILPLDERGVSFSTENQNMERVDDPL